METEQTEKEGKLVKRAVNIDYVRGEYLVVSIIQQITNLRNENSFNQIYNKAKQFCDINGIDLIQQYEIYRKAKILAHFNDCFINSTLEQHEKLSTSAAFMNQIYFPCINCILLYPESKVVLNIDDVNAFSRHIDIDSSALKNEFIVIKSMFMSTTINDVIQFLNELIPFSTAFQQTLRMIKSSIAMPISQDTSKRSFSKMKIIKNYLRNSMSDKRLSDLTVLTVERDIVIDYEQVVDKFARNHKNIRILLC
ncbi:unnamed protein product [Rotaria socialis]|uniref:HAT C-terminal dimerisation domain-containing protein n=1 Tax=Rotaria socialis TaxID=392032 RepID=A0A821R3G9_9BILA|nr:unnamed protein product [Rotaria socialis]